MPLTCRSPALPRCRGIRATHRPDRDRAFYPTVLIVVALYYVLFAVMSGSTRAVLIESLVMTGFATAAVTGFWCSRWIVVAGLFAHGVMDTFHGHVIENTGVPVWWPAFCAAYDVGAAAWMALVRQALDQGEPMTPGAPAALVVAGSLCMMLALVLAWCLAGLRMSAFIRTVFLNYQYLLKSHIDFLMMTGLLFVFFLLLAHLRVIPPAFVVVAMCVGSVGNPLGFLALALRPDLPQRPTSLFGAVMIGSFILTTVGYGGAAWLLACAVLSGAR